RPRLVVVGIVSLVAGMNENALQAQLADRALGLLDEGGSAARQNCREAVKHALVFLLNLGGIVRPLLHRRQLFMRGLAAQIVRRVGDHADIDAVLVVRVEKILQHHGTAALAPFRTTYAVACAAIVSRLFRRVDMRMPVDDHAVLLIACDSRALITPATCAESSGSANATRRPPAALMRSSTQAGTPPSTGTRRPPRCSD